MLKRHPHHDLHDRRLGTVDFAPRVAHSVTLFFVVLTQSRKLKRIR
jgi:hypothetical protein